MEVKTKVSTDSLGNITLYLCGEMSYINFYNFKKRLDTIILQHPNSKITLDFNNMDFVGSSGLKQLSETLQNLYQRKKVPIKISNISKEFIQTFKLYGFSEVSEIIKNFDTEKLNKKKKKKEEVT